MRLRRPLSGRSGLVIALLLVWCSTATAQAPEDKNIGEVFVLSLGGKLYDNLYTMTETPKPEKANPAYPAGVSSESLGTWRCVSCHGWDYSGSSGERGRVAGPHSALVSLRPLADADPARIALKIKGPPHAFDFGALPENVVEVLALFISLGQYDRAAIMTADGEATGTAKEGQMIFEGACSNCHQLDGRAYLRGERGDKSSLGWLSRNRPEQVVHKIMNGFPGTDMLSMRFLAPNHIADLLAYLQTLDKGG
ncbi:MAG: c-type cytochrome [Pseudomonadota bacterium]